MEPVKRLRLNEKGLTVKNEKVDWAKVVEVCNNNVFILNKIMQRVKQHNEDFYGAMIAGWTRSCSDVSVANYEYDSEKGEPIWYNEKRRKIECSEQ